MSLPRITPRRLDGSETFRSRGQPIPLDVLHFWRWSCSDLVSNATRGRVAEFIVAAALGIDTSGVRDEWAAYDLDMPEGIRIEVKSCGYLQSWHQTRPSSILFSRRPARVWSPETNQQTLTATRAAHVYVFALLAHLDKASLDPLNLDQWEFYVLPTSSLNERKRSQHSITLASLRKLNAGPIEFEQVRDGVLNAYSRGVANMGLADGSQARVSDRGSSRALARQK